MRRLIAILACLAVLPALAEDSPNTAKGFQPGHLYQFGDVSNVNLFNGNLNLALPIGQRFPLGGALSYGFNLAYAGNSWRLAFRERDDCPVEPNCGVVKTSYHYIPTAPNNAGLGWYFSSGGQLYPQDVGSQGVSVRPYRTPDGAEYEFPSNVESGLASGTSMRITSVSCADGTPCKDVEFADGTIHRFADSGGNPLIGIRDRFGNNVAVTITPPPPYAALPTTPPVWQFQDSAGRTQTAAFVRLTAPPLPNNGDEPLSFDAVKTVTLTAFGGSTATYTFHYSPDVNDGDHLTLVRRPIPTACACADLTFNDYLYVPLLTSITLPDGSSYAMTYYDGEDPNRSVSGSIKSLTLPTRGKYEWSYQTYRYPGLLGYILPVGGFQNPPDTVNYSIGLMEEIKRNAAGTAVERIHYDTNWNRVSSDNATTMINTVSTFAPGVSQDTLLSRAVHYFSLRENYGFALTRESASGADPNAPAGENIVTPETTGNTTRYLSTKTYDGAGTLLTYSYLTMGESGPSYNLPLSEKVVYRNSDGTTSSRTTDWKDPDGYGHFRTVVTSGTGFDGPITSRTVTTNYNRPDSDVGGDLMNTGTWGTSSFSPIPANKPWLVNMYTSVTTSEDGPIQKALYFFNTATGFLERSRVLKASAPVEGSFCGTKDLLARFSPDVNGNVALEEYFGGDGATLPTDPLASASLAGRTYALAHTYSKGALEKTAYISPSCTSVPQTNCASLLDVVNLVIDPGTGLTASSKDFSGIQSNFLYDSSGRVTGVSAPNTANVGYEYHKAGDPGFPVPTVIESVTSTTPNNSTTQTYEYDDFGRLTKETRSIPDGTASRVTAYDAEGRTKGVTEWETTPSPDASTRATRYTYDAMGRPVTITAPDSSTQMFTYLGARKVTRRELIGTSSVTADTVESYDVHGRLGSVFDANGTTTTYTYDVGNRLATVSVGGQERSFTYDNRGLLTRETHPENGTSDYEGYDARGHVGSKTVNSANSQFDLHFTYDGAERPLQILSRDPNASAFRLSKEMEYAATNVDAGNFTAGKLRSATRYNYGLPGTSVVTVKETFDYRDSAGRLSTKSTAISGINSSTRTYTQYYEHNDLGLVSRMLYPYADTSGTPTWDWVLPQYTKGRFTGASVVSNNPNLPAPDFTSGLSYWPNGMLHTLAHSNGVTDTYTMDSGTGMPRPRQITFEQWTGCNAPVITSQPVSTTIVYGAGLTLSVTATGDSPSYQWYSGQSPITGATAASYTVPSTQAGTYWVRVANACGRYDSSMISISVQLQAPGSLVADRLGSGITISWQASAGASSYQVFRRRGGVWTSIGTVQGSSMTDTNPPPGVTSVYRVVAQGTNLVTSGYSNIDIESTLTFTTITPGVTGVAYTHLQEILDGVNAVRWANGDSSWSWSQALSQSGCPQTTSIPLSNGAVTILAAHILALRCDMDNALQRLGMGVTSYTDPVIPPQSVMIKATHLTELQQRTDSQGDNR